MKKKITIIIACVAALAVIGGAVALIASNAGNHMQAIFPLLMNSLKNAGSFLHNSFDKAWHVKTHNRISIFKPSDSLRRLVLSVWTDSTTSGANECS